MLEVIRIGYMRYLLGVKVGLMNCMNGINLVFFVKAN
jgi:hypothetical protein